MNVKGMRIIPGGGWHCFLLALGALLVGGCAGGRPATTTPAPLPPPPMATHTPAAAPVASPSPTAAREQIPTAPVASPDIPAATAEPDIAATLVAGGAPRLYASYLSPDGAWRAEVHIFDCAPFPDGGQYAYDRLQIVETAGDEARFVDGQLQSCGGLGAFGLAGRFWSPSGRFFYYTTARDGVPDGCGHWTRPISRVDMADGSTADLGGGPLSPDGARLAVWDERDLVVYDIDGGAVGRVAAVDPAAALGPIAWSPDGGSLVYLQAGAFCVPGQSGQTTLARADLPGMASRVLLRSAEPAFQSVAWEEPGVLLLEDDAGGWWRYDLAGGTLLAVP